MSRISNLPFPLREAFANQSLLKVISGLNNFDAISVSQVAKAAQAGGATLLDMACDSGLVQMVKRQVQIPICVSAVEPSLFGECIEAGASMIEIGNYDSFYSQGRVFEAEEVLSLTRETRSLYPNVVLSVTVPHFLPLHCQSALALELVDCGADVIQTEGGTSASPLSPGTLGLIEKASPTLASVFDISQTFQQHGLTVPLICSSGLSSVTIPLAYASGACGVGVGSAINRLTNQIEMIAMVRTLEASVMNSRHLSQVSN